MRTLEPARWDDYILAGLLLVIAVPRAVLSVMQDYPLGVEGTISLLGIAIALWLLIGRRR